MYTFQDILDDWPRERVEALLASVTPADAEAAIHKEDRTERDLAALLSPHADALMEPIAHEAQRLSRWHFGRIIGLYVPIYLSNVCGADCTYCGYAVRSGNKEKRITLNEAEIRQECETLAETGYQNVLLLTGEAPHAVPVDYIADSVAIVREYFPSVSVEIYSLDSDDYERLTDLGLEGVTIYMETYDKVSYADVHLLGAKSDYAYRLDAIERAGHAGTRKLNIGVLLGLAGWRVDCFWLALHGQYLQKTCWQSSVSISFPRLQHVPERFHIPALVSNREMVQIMLAMRLYLPEAGFNVSTRETPSFRDNLIPLGTTMMSAGSSTRPGGYTTTGEDVLQQFELEDHRTLAEVAEVIRDAGYDPVWKDFDRAFDDVRSEVKA
ncbi:MAG: 2-iminoacetate synthase ThiH [Candidatus Hydrogenedentota bacterium]